MLNKTQRKIAQSMIDEGYWHIVSWMRMYDIQPIKYEGFKGDIVYEEMLKQQVVDTYRHAPCCPGNNYHKRRLVWQPCTCGAVYYAELEAKENASRS